MSERDEKRIRAKWSMPAPGDPTRRIIVNHDVAILLDEIERLRGIVGNGEPKPASTEAA